MLIAILMPFLSFPRLYRMFLYLDRNTEAEFLILSENSAILTSTTCVTMCVSELLKYRMFFSTCFLTIKGISKGSVNPYLWNLLVHCCNELQITVSKLVSLKVDCCHLPYPKFHDSFDSTPFCISRNICSKLRIWLKMKAFFYKLWVRDTCMFKLLFPFCNYCYSPWSLLRKCWLGANLFAGREVL